MDALEIKFWDRVRIGDGCWEWTACKLSTGYGQLASSGGPFVSSHRFSWELTNGPIAPGLCVMHRCDHRLCVRPSHLRLGTNDENMADMAAKKRAAHGEMSGKAKFGEERARELIRRRLAGERKKDFAAEFGVSLNTVFDIVRGKTWKHLDRGAL